MHRLNSPPVPGQHRDFIGRSRLGSNSRFAASIRRSLHVSGQSGPRGSGEAPFQATLRDAAMSYRRRHGVWLAVVLGKPALGLAHNRIRMRLPAHKANIWKLTLSMPFEKIDLAMRSASPGLICREMI